MLYLPAAFRRLCVETMLKRINFVYLEPAAFRRLCVETDIAIPTGVNGLASRLQAAVC